MEVLAGIDIGTMGCKTVLIDEEGNMLGSSNKEYPISSPKPNWAEQNPKWWWNAAKKTLREAISVSNVDPRNIVSIGLCGQMHTNVLLDNKGKVLRHAITWVDQRSAPQVEVLKGKYGDDFISKCTLNPITTTYTLPQLLWVKENEPEIFKKTYKVIIAKDYVKYRLTKKFVTDYSEASGYLCFNVEKRMWADELLQELSIPQGILPDLAKSSSEVIGEVSNEAARETGLRRGTPVIAGGADQATGATGAGIIEEGQTGVVIGTAGTSYICTNKPLPDPKLRLFCWCHTIPNKWITLGATQTAGLSLRWFRESFGEKEIEEEKKRNVNPYALFDSMAEAIPIGSEGLIFLPYLMGERAPHWDPNAKGVFYGITLRHGKAHFIRSILEGVAFSLRDIFELIRELGLRASEVRSLGGGAKSELWRKILADLFNVSVIKLKLLETAAFGAAVLAGVGAGVYKSVETAVEKTVKIEKVTQPNPENHIKYEKYYNVYREIYPNLKPIFSRMAKK